MYCVHGDCMFNTSQKINLTYFSGIEKSTSSDNKRKIVLPTAYITIHQPIALSTGQIFIC